MKERRRCERGSAPPAHSWWAAREGKGSVHDWVTHTLPDSWSQDRGTRELKCASRQWWRAHRRPAPSRRRALSKQDKRGRRSTRAWWPIQCLGPPFCSASPHSLSSQPRHTHTLTPGRSRARRAGSAGQLHVVVESRVEKMNQRKGAVCTFLLLSSPRPHDPALHLSRLRHDVPKGRHTRQVPHRAGQDQVVTGSCEGDA